MKKLFLLSAIACAALAGSDTLADALKNGKASGDVTAFSEGRHINKGNKNLYYNNTSYVVGSVGLGYESDYYQNFKAVVGFRGAAPLYERHRNQKTLHGTGDSTERIYENDRFLMSQLYLEYNAFDTVVKVGRQNMYSDWLGRYNDGVSIVNNSISNLTLEGFYTRAQGRASHKEMWGFTSRNKEHGGVFNAGATYKFTDGLSAKIYGLYASEVFSALGGKLMYDGHISEEFSAGGMIHYAQSDEKKRKDDGKMFEATAYAKFNEHKFTLGYARSGKAIGWGSLNLTGDHIVPFEEGDVMYERDARTLYAMVDTSIEKLNLTVLAGTTKYKLKGGDYKNYKQHEVSVWASYPLMENLKAFVIYDQVFKAQPGYPSLTQIGAGLTYSF
ncbi:Opr family porin [Campylobacter sp. FOBRC14]|uniref:Opr family porin n=1 Tax=Campylobacter sp. FOBRC14 TaxID=936554 RepID=UPI00027A3813|nr:Opr family porin [Campylobacter sp. FOBRC14]EJP74956.1 outer membrane porin, OprD domain protein [Campylobacter sp. FOBRC14]